MTSHAAHKVFNENLKDTLTNGKLAEFVILDQNPIKLKPMEIKNISVLENIKEGKTIVIK